MSRITNKTFWGSILLFGLLPFSYFFSHSWPIAWQPSWLSPWLSPHVSFIKNDDFSCYFKENTLKLSWIHSVELSRWIETYQITDEGFHLVGSQFKTYGAGTPDAGKLISTKEGWISYEVDRLLPTIHWYISRNVESTLIIAQHQYPIYQQFEDYTELNFSTQKIPLWTLLKKENCHDYFSPKP